MLAQFNQPEQMVFGSDGAMYVAYFGNSAIRKIFNGTVTTLYKFDTLMSKGYKQLSIGPDNTLYTALNTSTLVRGYSSSLTVGLPGDRSHPFGRQLLLG
jgi:hypothetical protein